MEEHITTKIKASDPALRSLQIQYSRKEIFWNNLIAGLAWWLGATVCVSILLAITDVAFHYINLVPVVGSFVSNVMDYVKQHQSTFPR